MTGFPDKKVIAELTAKMLIEVEAVRFMSDKPFIFTSGWASPVYTDCRRLISFPRVRRTLIDFGVATVEREVGFEQFVATTARQNGFIYGLVTAFMALMTGWMASIVFRKD